MLRKDKSLHPGLVKKPFVYTKSIKKKKPRKIMKRGSGEHEVE